MPIPEMMPYSYTDNYLEIYADPYLQVTRQKEYFDADLAKLGIIPIQVLIRNKSDRSFEVPYAPILLELANGAQVPRSHLDDLMLSPEERLNELRRQQSAAMLGMPSDLRTLFVLAALAAAFLVVTIPVWGPFTYVAHRSKQARLEQSDDYKKKELESNLVLSKDQSAHGFLFFLVPPDSDLTAPANLVFSFEELGNPAIIRLFLKDLGSRQESRAPYLRKRL